MAKPGRKLYDNSDPISRNYCEAIENLRDHCEATGQNFVQTMIDIIEAKLTDDRRGRDAEGSRNHA